MPCLSSPISSQLPLMTAARFYEVTLHTSGGICSCSCSRIIRESSHHHPPRAAPVWACAWHPEAAMPTLPWVQPSRDAGTSGSTSPVQGQGEKPQNGRTQSHGQPEEQEGPAPVPGGWVMREILLTVLRERGVTTVCPTPTPHQSHWLCLYFRSSQ